MTPYNSSLGVYAVGVNPGHTRTIIIRNPWWGPTWDSMVASAGVPPGPLEMYEYVAVTQLYDVNQGFYVGTLRFNGGPDWYDGNAYITQSSHFLQASQYGL